MCHDVLGDPELLEALVEAYLTSGRRMGMVVTVLLDETKDLPAAISPSPPAGRGPPPLQRS